MSDRGPLGDQKLWDKMIMLRLQVAARAHWVLGFGNYSILGLVLWEWGSCLSFLYVLRATWNLRNWDLSGEKGPGFSLCRVPSSKRGLSVVKGADLGLVGGSPTTASEEE